MNNGRTLLARHNSQVGLGKRVELKARRPRFSQECK